VNRLTAPVDSIAEPEGRRQAQFLAAILLVLVPLGVAASIVAALLRNPVGLLSDTNFYVAVGTGLVGVVAYHLSRTKDYRLAATLTVTVSCLAAFSATFTDSSPQYLEAAFYLVIPVLLASVLLSARAAATMTAIQAVGLLIVPLVVPGANWMDSVVNPFIYYIVAAVLVLLIADYRARMYRVQRVELEQWITDRTAEIVQNNDALKRQITERDNAETRLAEERNLLRTLIDSLPDPVFVKDPQGRIVLNNAADARAFDLTPAESVGKTDFDLFPGELAEQHVIGERAIFERGEVRVDYEEMALDRSGNPRWTLTTKTPLHDSQGRLIGLVGISRDITGRKQSETSLRQTHDELERRVNERTAELLQANADLRAQIAERERVEAELQRERDFALQVMNALGPGLTVTDEQRHFVYVNPAFAQMLGYTPEALLGKTPMDLTFPDEIVLLNTVREERQAGKATTYEMRLRRVDGTPVPVLITGVPRWQDGKVIGAIGSVTDLTAHKQAEAALHVSEERFSKAFHANPSAIVISSLEEGRIVDANESYLNLIGYARAEVIGRTDNELTTWADPADRDRMVQGLRETGSISRQESCVRQKSGEIRFALVSLEIIELDGLPHLLGMFDDITERRQMEEALRQSMARYQTVSEMISDYTYSYEVLPEGAIHHDWTTDSFTRVTGYTPADLGNSLNLYHPDDEPLVQQHVRDTIAGNLTSGDYRIITKTGETRWLHITRKPVWDDREGRVVRFFGVAQDITERKMAEEALKETNQTLRALIEGSPLVIISLDADGNVRLWNPAAERLFGWKAEEVIGKPYPLVTEENRSEFNVLFTHILRGGTLNNVELRRLKRDGALLDISLSSGPLYDAQGRITGTITLMADLTERKRAEEALRASEEASRQFQEQLKALHDITIEMSKADSVDEICRLAVELGRSRLGYDRLGIWFVDETVEWATGSFGTDEQGRIRDERGKRNRLDDDVVTREILTGGRLYFQEPAPLRNDRMEIVGEGWVAMAALRDGERVIGSISADNLLQRQPIPRYQLELLSLYGSTIGHLCTRKRAEAAEHDQRQLAEALRDTAAAINSTLELDTMLDRLLIQVERVIPNDASTIMLIEGGYAHMARFRGYEERGLAVAVSGVHLSLADTPNLRAMAQTGQPFVIASVEEYPDWRLAPETAWIKSHVGAPIQIEGLVIGFLSISSATPGRFTQAQAERLKAFADQAAIAIQNARLYDAVRRHADELEQRVAARTAELEAERAQLRAILDAMSEGVTGVIFDKDLQVERRFINEAFHQLFGYTAEEWTPYLVRSTQQSESSYRQLLQAADDSVMRLGIWHGEPRLRRRDGTEFDASMTSTRVTARDGQIVGIVTVFRDISQEKALQDQRSRFVAYASHELRTPITNLKTRLYLMRRQPEKLDEHLVVVEEVTERMKTLVEDLLDLSRLERGIIPLKRQTLDVQGVIMDVIRVQRPEAERKDITLTCEFPSDPLYINADRERITQVITNLVTNAIHYTAPGGSVHVTAESNSDGDIVVYVEDTGVGIAPDHLPHIFQPFYRVDESADGTGLGLSITREIVELHQGRISVESEIGRGSCFALRFARQAG
jgi:PAS domain S-box-containing protein